MGTTEAAARRGRKTLLRGGLAKKARRRLAAPISATMTHTPVTNLGLPLEKWGARNSINARGRNNKSEKSHRATRRSQRGISGTAVREWARIKTRAGSAGRM